VNSLRISRALEKWHFENCLFFFPLSVFVFCGAIARWCVKCQCLRVTTTLRCTASDLCARSVNRLRCNARLDLSIGGVFAFLCLALHTIQKAQSTGLEYDLSQVQFCSFSYLFFLDSIFCVLIATSSILFLAYSLRSLTRGLTALLADHCTT
jgi:hypothetical protein